jgi:hypothetical protein
MKRICLAVAAAMLPVAVQASEAPFCAGIKGDDIKVFDAVIVASADTASAPLVKRKPIARERFDLVTRWYTLADQGLATDGGKLPSVPFRAFRVGAERRLCTAHARETLFGKPLADPNFMLRCLVDADDDGRFEGYQASAELVSYDMRTMARGKPAGTLPPVRSFEKPITLVEASGLTEPNAAFAPRIVAEARVAEITSDAVIIERKMQVAMLPGRSGERFRDWADAERWTVPLRQGLWTAPDGTLLELVQGAKGWMVAAPKGWFAPPRLACGKSVVELPHSIAIVGEGGMAVLAKPSS